MGWSELNHRQALPSLDNGRLSGSHMSYNTPALFWLLAGMPEENHTQAGHPLPEVGFGEPRRRGVTVNQVWWCVPIILTPDTGEGGESGLETWSQNCQITRKRQGMGTVRGEETPKAR